MNPATEPADEMAIRSSPSPRCVACGGEGVIIHRGLKDRLFNASGSWDLKQCSRPGCAVVWPDPMPLQEDIGKAYANYYTHAHRAEKRRAGLLRRTLQLMRSGYIAEKYGYVLKPDSFGVKCLGKLLRLMPIRRRETEADVRCLQAVPNGRLLDVGCGSGEWLLLMRDLGWNVEGVDFDEHAVKVAAQRGVPVRCGALEQQNYPEKSFDAVTLSHVIEHVPDPVQTLAACARILKPGGTLVLFTPNSASLGHRLFKQDWRGLEPPRHLHVFSPQSMSQVLAAAGFDEVAVHPFIVSSIIYESILLRWGSMAPAGKTRRNWPAWMLTQLFKPIELCFLGWNPALGDCIIAIATKK